MGGIEYVVSLSGGINKDVLWPVQCETIDPEIAQWPQYTVSTN